MNDQDQEHQAPQGHPHTDPAKTGTEKAASATTAEIVQQWVGQCIQNSPAARNTEGYNHLVNVAIPELLRRLSAS